MSTEPAGNGVLWWPTDRADAALIVVNSRVVDAVPLWAGKKLIGCDARRLWRSGTAHGLRLRWAAGVERFEPHTVIDKTRVQRWRSGDPGFAGERHLTIGVLPDGRWWIHDTADPCGWTYPDKDSAEDEIKHRLAGGEWVDVGFPPAPHRQPGQ